MSEPIPPPDRLRIKTETSLSGQACCPSCGGLLSASPDQCMHCGWNRHQRVVRPRVPGRRGRGLGWLLAPIRWLMRGLLVLVLLAAAAVAITWAYQRWWPTATPVNPTTHLAAPGACVTCRGTGLVMCKSCGGTGQVDGTPIPIPCDQCDGKGNYHPRLGGKNSSVSKCPFCKGTGIKAMKTVRETCSVCQGKGRVPCPDCQPTGPSSGR